MNRLERFLNNVEPYDCNREEFRGVQVLLKDISYSSERKEAAIEQKNAIIAEKSKEITQSKNEYIQIRRTITIERIVLLGFIIIAFIWMSTFLVGIYFSVN